jgi:nitroreductase
LPQQQNCKIVMKPAVSTDTAINSLPTVDTFRPAMHDHSDTPSTRSLDFLDARRSQPSRLLGEPGPSPAQLQRWLTASMRVPDHGRLTPWRFLTIEGEARHELGRRLEKRALDLDPTLGAAQRSKELNRFACAPLIVAVIGKQLPDHKIPQCEQLLSAGCVCFSLLLAAQADGFAAQWLTGWASYDPVICRHLGLEEHESVTGFIHIGSSSDRVAERERPALEDRLTKWQP